MKLLKPAILLPLAVACGEPLDPLAEESAAISMHAFDPLHVLVAFRPGTSGLSKTLAHSAIGGTVANTLSWMNLDVVTLPPTLDPLTASQRYRSNPNVLYAHPNWVVSLHSIPNDLLFAQDWGLHNTGQSVLGSTVVGVADADIDAPEGWTRAFGAGNFESSGGTRVGIIDTGIDRTHLDLLNKTAACASALLSIGLVIEGTCSDDHFHGTHVAGTIGAIANNTIGVAGVAPNASFAVFKGLNAAGSGFYADIVAGVRWLRTNGGAQIISMSIGGPEDAALNAELSAAAAAGVLLIAAAGNDGDATPNFPAYHPDVVSVAATDAADAHADFSNCNDDVELAAPGVDVWSTAPANAYLLLSGTSMATPHVSGVAAMIMSELGFNAAQTRARLRSSAEDLGPGGWDSCFGHGRVNLDRALQ